MSWEEAVYLQGVVSHHTRLLLSCRWFGCTFTAEIWLCCRFVHCRLAVSCDLWLIKNVSVATAFINSTVGTVVRVIYDNEDTPDCLLESIHCHIVLLCTL